MIPIARLTLALGNETILALSDDNADGLPDANVLETALTTAEDYVRETLALDAAALTPRTEDIILTLAIERLFERRTAPVPETWRQRASRARILLTEPTSTSIAPANTVLGITAEDRTPDRAALHRL